MTARTCLPTAITALAVSLLAGCISYEPAPIDLDTFDHDWQSRMSDTEALGIFAEGIGEPVPAEQNGGLSLDEAIVVALYGNPELRHARLEAGVELATAENAGLWDDPELSFNLMRNVDTGTDPWIYGASLGFTVPLSGRLGVERDQAWADYQSAWHAVAVAEWELVRALTRDWVAWSATLAQAEAQGRYLTDLDALISTADALVEQGELSPAEVRLLRIEQVQRAVTMAELEREAARQRRALIAMMGLRPGTVYALTPGLPVPEGEGDTEGDAPEPSAQTHPRVLAAVAAYEQAEQALRREVVKQYPDLSIGPAFENDEGQSRIGLGLGLPLPFWNANRQGIAQAAAARDAAHARVELAYQQAAAELHEARMRRRSAATLRRAVAEELLPLTTQQIDEARRLIELGEVDVLLLSQAVVAAADTELMMIRLRAEHAAAALDYERLTHTRWTARPEARTEN